MVHYLLLGFAEEMRKEAKKERTQEEEDAIRDLKASGAIMGLLGAPVIGASLPELTGRTAVYHGTSPEGYAAIMKDGLKTREQMKNVGAGSVTESLGFGTQVEKDSRDLVFVNKNKQQGVQYAAQNAAYDKLKKEHPNMPDKDLWQMAVNSMKDETQKTIRKLAPKDSVVKAKVPLWRLREDERLVQNPEIAWNLGGREEHNKAVLRQFKQDNPHLPPPTLPIEIPVLRRVNGKYVSEDEFMDLSFGEAGGNYSIKDGIEKKYIPGSDGYERLGIKELTEYVKKNKGQFGKGVAKATAGAGMLGGSAYLAHSLLKDKEKNASNISDADYTYAIDFLPMSPNLSNPEADVKLVSDRLAKAPKPSPIKPGMFRSQEAADRMTRENLAVWKKTQNKRFRDSLAYDVVMN